MHYKVVVYFDNMIDEIQVFDTKGEAYKHAVFLQQMYRGQRLYKIEVQPCEENEHDE